MYLQGNFGTEDFAYLEISILGCDLPDDQCSDISEVDNLMVSMITLQSHVDFEEKSGGDDVISYSLDTSNVLVMDKNVIQKVNLFY